VCRRSRQKHRPLLSGKIQQEKNVGVCRRGVERREFQRRGNLSEWDRASGVVALPQSIHTIPHKIINKSHSYSTVSIKIMKITPWCAFYCKRQGMDKGPLLLSAEFPSGSLDPSQL
jgi:hypothetical protein